MTDLERLQAIYKLPLTTDDVKKEAWNIRGITGSHFRLIVRGIKPNGDAYKGDDVLGCIQALKQAFANNLKKRKEFNSKLQKNLV